jgi:uncharacterized protein YecE (DUF72 family)
MALSLFHPDTAFNIAMKPTSQHKVGCCGFREARAKYFRKFPLVEVQQTFYEPPKPSTLKSWREEAPEDFEFSLKA